MNLATTKSNIEGLSSSFTPQRTAETPAFKFDFRRGLQFHPRLAMAVAAFVFTLLVFAGLRQPRLYQASTLIYVQPTASRTLGEANESNYDAMRYDSYIEQQKLTLVRSDIVSKGLETLPPAVWQQSPAETLQAAAVRWGSAFKITRLTTSYELAITATGADPNSVAAVVNAVTAAYLRDGRRDELAQSDQRTEVLTEERARIVRNMEAARREQAGLSASIGTARPGADNMNPYDVGLTGLRSDLAIARVAHDQASAQLASVPSDGSRRSPGLTAAVDEAIATDPGLISMKTITSDRRTKLIGQMAGLTPNNPVYRQDQEEIAQLDRSLEAMTETLRTKNAAHLQEKLRLDVTRTGDLEARLNGDLARQAAAATTAAPKLQRAADLTADLQRMQTRLASVDDAMRGLQLENNSPGLAHLSLAAAVPTVPEFGRGRILILAALPMALLCGLLTASIALKFDREIFTASDVEQVLGFPPMAVLPAVFDVSTGVLEEYMLRVSAGIEHSLRVSNARTIVITAVSPSVDVSSLVSSVQAKLNGMGILTCVMNAASILETQSASSQDHADSPATTLMKSDGALPPARRRESYAIANLQKITREYDLLLIEAAPLLISGHTEYMARSADATILVADSGVTLREDLLQSALLLQRLHARGAGIVLKDLQLSQADPLYRRTIHALEQRTTNPMPASSRKQEAKTVSSVQAMQEPVIRKGPDKAKHSAAAKASQNTDHPLARIGVSARVSHPQPAYGVPEIVESPLPEAGEPTMPSESNRLLFDKPDGDALEHGTSARRWQLLSRTRDREPQSTLSPEDIDSQLGQSSVAR